MLTLLIIVPILGAIVMYILPENYTKKGSLLISILTFAISGYVWIIFDWSITGYQIVYSTTVGFGSLSVGVDGISIYYIILTGLLTPVCLLSSWSNVKIKKTDFRAVQLLTSGLLIAVFIVTDILIFYVTFESVLVPLFYTVGIWSSSKTKERSANLLFLYTLAGSLFMLLAIVSISSQVGTTDFSTLDLIKINPEYQNYLFIGFFIALAVKTPLVPFHIWLPRAHADAPLAGSIVLAGTVLKLATYGYLRILLPILPNATEKYIPIIVTIAVISIGYSSLTTIRQSDFKALIAYSSVAHIGVVVLGIFSNNILGIEGAIILSLAHGLISPALFLLVGGVLYDRYITRVLHYYRGISNYIPVFSSLFFLAICANIGVPLTINWISEFIALAGAFQKSTIGGILGATGIIFSACYSIYCYNRIVTGTPSRYITYASDVSRREFNALISLIALALLFGIIPKVILVSIHSSVSALPYIIV